MKYSFIIIFLSLFKLFLFDCIPDKNCFKNRGVCINNTCECYDEFWTLEEKNQNNKLEIYCNYEKQSRFKPFILEFFFPSIGHFVMKKYILGIIKIIFLLISILSISIGYIIFKSGNSKDNSKENNQNEEQINLINNENNKHNIVDNKINNDISGEGDDSLNLSGKLHIANHERIPISCLNSFLLFIEGISLCAFFIMYISDLIGYGFAIYKDENNVPLY